MDREQKSSETSWAQLLKEELQRQRQLRSLTRGLRRSLRWKTLLQPILLSLRQRLQEPQKASPLPLMPESLQLGRETLTWALETLEDLYLLVQTLELQMEQQISEIRQQ